jgi:hypothetical protein
VSDARERGRRDLFLNGLERQPATDSAPAHTLTVSLFSIRSGARLLEQTLGGGDPRECDLYEFNTVDALVGSSPTAADVKAALAGPFGG